MRQPVPGTYVWLTRHGYVVITNDTGTHIIGDIQKNQLAADIWQSADQQQRLHALDVA